MKTETPDEKQTCPFLAMPLATSLARFPQPFRRAILGLCLCSPIVLTLIYIQHYGVNVPFEDQWSFLEFMEKWYTHTATLPDLFAQHNEHRIVFPRLIMLGLARATRYNTLAEMYFSWLCMCVSSLVIFLMYRRTVGISDLTMVQFIPFVWLLFSWRQVENWLWGFQLGFFLPLALVLCAFALLEISAGLDLYFAGAIAAASVASFSLAGALAVWPIGLWQLWSHARAGKIEGAKTGYRIAWIWGLVGIGVCGLYLTGYRKPPYHPSLTYSFEHPLAALVYFFTVIGSALTVESYSAFTIGFLIVSLGVCSYGVRRANPIPLASFWSALVLFALSCAVLMMVGRAAFGIQQALASRYTTFTIVGVIGLYARLLVLASGRRVVDILLYGFLSALVAHGILVSLHFGFDEARMTQGRREKAAYVLQTLSEQGDAEITRLLFPEPMTVRQLTPFLEKQKLNIFATKKSDK